MALNKFMHPRNPYKNQRPDFQVLAAKYEEFRSHSKQDLRGKVIIDFKDPESLRALTWALLKNDFNLDVEIPLDRLVPTVPLRLNYILWLEDLLDGKTEGVKGIDIGKEPVRIIFSMCEGSRLPVVVIIIQCMQFL